MSVWAGHRGVGAYARLRLCLVGCRHPSIALTRRLCTCVLMHWSVCQARNEEELSAREGEFLQVLDSSDPDWYHVKPIARLAESGYVPVSYCEAQDLSKMEPGARIGCRLGGQRHTTQIYVHTDTYCPRMLMGVCVATQSLVYLHTHMHRTTHIHRYGPH